MKQNKKERSLLKKVLGMKTKKGSVVPMEMVQVAILIALAVALGLIFRTEITSYVNNTFEALNA